MYLSSVEIKEAVKMAFGSLRANKFRSFLTILGVLIGVTSVIGLSSIIDGLARAVDEEINSIGTNVIYITKYSPSTDWEDLSDEERIRKPITSEEANVIMAECPSITGVSPQNFYFKPGGNEIKYMGNKYNQGMISGTWPDFLKVRSQEMSQGRFFDDTDEKFRLMNCVIGSRVAEALFEGASGIDKLIRVNGREFQVIGVLKEFESNFGDDEINRSIMMPLSTFEKIHPWEKELSLMASAVSHDKIDQAKEEITAALRLYRRVPFNKPDNFAMSTQDNIREEVGDITGYLYFAMIAITSVGLLVGGIGVTNIMLVSVTERTREIGVRKAIGARRANIISQFLTEAMTLSGTGGVLGILVGIPIGLAANAIAGFPNGISIPWVLIGFFVSVTVGLVSGIYPAAKAAKLDPIEALRYE